MKRLAILALFLAGCTAPLQTAISVSNALGTVASESGEAVNRAAVRAEHACLWRSDGSEVTTQVAEQKSCVASVRAQYAPALASYDDFYAAWVALSAAVHAAEAAEVLGRAPDLARLEGLIAALTTAADAAAHAAEQVSR